MTHITTAAVLAVSLIAGAPVLPARHAAFEAVKGL